MISRIGGARDFARLLQQVEDLCLNRHVERRRRLVGDDQRGIVRDGHRDHHALAHAAGEFVRERRDAPARVRNADQREQLDRTIARGRRADVVVHTDRLDDLVADGVDRRQRRQRVLKDHRDAPAAQTRQFLVRQPDELPAFETDGSRRPRA